MKKDDLNSDISLYLNYLKEKNLSGFLSGRTMNDLNFEDLFESLDLTTSKVGQQYFYTKLCANNLSAYSKEHEKITEKFSTDADFVLQTEKQLKKLEKRDAYNIISLFTKELPGISTFYSFVINILRFVPFTFAVLLIAFHLNFCFYLLVLSIVVNFVIYYMNKSVQIPFQYAIPQLLVLMKCSAKLAVNPKFDCLSKGILKDIDTLKPISKSSTLFKIENLLTTDISEVTLLVTELFKIITLTEPYLFYKTTKLINGKQKEIEKLYCFAGEIDSLLTISKIRSAAPWYCLPSNGTSKVKFSFSDMIHPLVPFCVANSLSIKGKSILLTGSNMSGKSTFIRTIGVNILLAQTINTCFARHFHLHQACILDSMITISDDLMNSKSLFFEEVLTMKQMLESSENGYHIYLLDEIFKGTNTLERIGAAKAVLSHLIKNGNIVFVSTHDIELAELLDSEYELYHFCEHIQKGEVEFDYLLKHGKLTSFNAIKILKMSGYDEEIIDEANNTILKLMDKKIETLSAVN